VKVAIHGPFHISRGLLDAVIQVLQNAAKQYDTADQSAAGRLRGLLETSSRDACSGIRTGSAIREVQEIDGAVYDGLHSGPQAEGRVCKPAGVRHDLLDLEAGTRRAGYPGRGGGLWLRMTFPPGLVTWLVPSG